MTALRVVGKAVFAAADLLHRTPTGPRVLIYHQVGAGLQRQMEVGREDFLWQLDWLVHNREVVPIAEAIERWNEPESDRLVVITFDDGYRDTHRVAFPALRDRGLPFTLYLSTAHMETGDGPQGAEPLTWGEVAEMVESGLVTVGSHTHTHLDLRVAEPDRVKEEMSKADDLIGERLGITPRHFAYPWGYWSEVADNEVRRRYDSATLGSPHRPGMRGDPYLMHRFPVQLSDRRVWFRRRLIGGLLLEEKVRRRIRGYAGP